MVIHLLVDVRDVAGRYTDVEIGVVRIEVT